MQYGIRNTEYGIRNTQYVIHIPYYVLRITYCVLRSHPAPAFRSTISNSLSTIAVAPQTACAPIR